MPSPELVAHGGRIELKLLRRPLLGGCHQLFQRADKRLAGHQRLHRLDVEQRGVVVAMLGVGGRAGQQHQSGPARSERLEGAVPRAIAAAGGRLLLAQPLGQLLVLLPRLRRPLLEFFQQVGPIVAREHGRAHRHRHDLVAPDGLVELEQIEDISPRVVLAVVANFAVLVMVAVVALSSPRRSFSGSGAICRRAASVPSMADGRTMPSASRDLAAARSFSVVSTTVKSEPVWACHSPRSRSAALANAGSSTTRSRNLTPASGSAAGGVAGSRIRLPAAGRGQHQADAGKPGRDWPGRISWQHGIHYAAGGQRFAHHWARRMFPWCRARCAATRPTVVSATETT